MNDDARSIDVSALAELVRIRRDEDLLKDRLDKMEAKKTQVSPLVYRRVRADYEARKASLDAEARAPRERAGREYVKLRALTATAEKATEDARLEKEELEFRHELGEFAETDFQARYAAGTQRLNERQAELERLLRLREDFVAAFGSLEDLEKVASGPAMGAPPIAVGATSARPRPQEPAGGLTSARPTPPMPQMPPMPPMPPPVPQMPAASPDSTRVQSFDAGPQAYAPPAPAYAPAPAPIPYAPSPGSYTAPMPAAAVVAPPPAPLPPPAPPAPAPASEGGATMMMELPRIVIFVDDAPHQEYVLRPETTSIGRAPDAKIQLPYKDVSRQHATIVPEGTPNKYKIVDLGSENGVFVNGERVKEKMLVDGDVIYVGRRKLVYRG